MANVAIFMVGCTDTILDEIASGATQKQVALSYAYAIRAHHARPPVETVDWPRINAALVGRWGERGRERVKAMAWELVGRGSSEERRCKDDVKARILGMEG